MPAFISVAKKRQPALIIILASLLTLILTACGSTTNNSVGSAPATVATPTNLLQAKQLLVGSDTTYTPMEYLDTTSNDYAGFDIDLIKAISAKMGLTEVTKKTGFDTIFDDLNNKRFDIVISSVTINSDRQKKFNFIPYFNAGESLLVKKGNPEHLKSVADLCGLKIGVQTGTVEQTDLDTGSTTCKSKGKPAIQETVLQDQTAVVQLLANGRVDATYQDSPVTDYYNKINPGQFEVGGSVVNAAPYGIVVRKGDTSMFNSIQAALKAVKADGTYDKLFTKWGFTASQKG